MEPEEITRFFCERSGGLSLVEANKGGLYDGGVEPDGSDANAALAKLLGLPVVLVIDTLGMSRGIAPLLLGYRAFDEEVNIAGVILNKVGGARHEAKLMCAVETYSGLPVLGSVWRNAGLEIGERHLGLTPPSETDERDAIVARTGEIVGGSVDLERVRKLANGAPDLEVAPHVRPVEKPGEGLRIGYARDAAFGFYYPDDLEAFEAAGGRFGADRYDAGGVTALYRRAVHRWRVSRDAGRGVGRKCKYAQIPESGAGGRAASLCRVRRLMYLCEGLIGGGAP